MAVNVIANFDIPAFEKSISAFVQKVTIATAEKELRAAVGKGFDNEPVVVTDGVPRRDYAQVKPFGKIEFIRRPNMADAVAWALTELQKRSPVKTGRYVASHMVLINGTEVTGNIMVALRNVKPTDRVQIVNPQPYARKLEGATARKSTGRGKRRGSSRQARNGIYRVVLRELVQRYGRSMFFDFKYVKLNTGVKVWGDLGGKYRSRKFAMGTGWRTIKVKRVQRDQVFPALQFYIKPTGAAN